MISVCAWVAFSVSIAQKNALVGTTLRAAANHNVITSQGSVTVRSLLTLLATAVCVLQGGLVLIVLWHLEEILATQRTLLVKRSALRITHHLTVQDSLLEPMVSSTLLKSNQVTVQVRQIPCMSNSFCISAVAVRAGSSNLVIRSSHNGSGKALVWFNRKLTEKTRLDLASDYKFRKISPLGYEIVKKDGRTMSLKVKAWQRYLSFEITSSATICSVPSGLCSSCDSNIENDFTNSTSAVFWGKSISQRKIIDILKSQWRVADVDSLFVFGSTSFKERREITSNGYALHFSGSLAFSNNLNASFVQGKDLTVQFFVRIHASGGTILSYAKDYTFAIVNDAKVKIYLGAKIYDIGVSLPMRSWVQVSITYNSAIGT